MKFSIKNIFSKCDEIGSFLRSRSHLLKKSLMENFIFCAVLFLKKRLLLKPLLFTVSNKLLICSLLKQKGCNISFFSERDKNNEKTDFFPLYHFYQKYNKVSNFRVLKLHEKYQKSCPDLCEI